MGVCSSVATTFNTPMLSGGPASATWCWLIGSCMCLTLGMAVLYLDSYHNLMSTRRRERRRDRERVPHMRRAVSIHYLRMLVRVTNLPLQVHRVGAACAPQTPCHRGLGRGLAEYSRPDRLSVLRRVRSREHDLGGRRGWQG